MSFETKHQIPTPNPEATQPKLRPDLDDTKQYIAPHELLDSTQRVQLPESALQNEHTIDDNKETPSFLPVFLLEEEESPAWPSPISLSAQSVKEAAQETLQEAAQESTIETPGRLPVQKPTKPAVIPESLVERVTPVYPETSIETPGRLPAQKPPEPAPVPLVERLTENQRNTDPIPIPSEELQRKPSQARIATQVIQSRAPREEIPTSVIVARRPQKQLPLAPFVVIALALFGVLIFVSLGDTPPKPAASVQQNVAPAIASLQHPKQTQIYPTPSDPNVPDPQKEISIFVASNPTGAKVLLDGVVVGVTPISKKVAASDSNRTLTITKEGFHTFEESLVLVADYRKEIILPREEKPKKTEPKAKATSIEPPKTIAPPKNPEPKPAESFVAPPKNPEPQTKKKTDPIKNKNTVTNPWLKN